MAWTGETLTKELGGSDIHARAGAIDDVAESEAEGFKRARTFLGRDAPPLAAGRNRGPAAMRFKPLATCWAVPKWSAILLACEGLMINCSCHPKKGSDNASSRSHAARGT